MVKRITFATGAATVPLLVLGSLALGTAPATAADPETIVVASDGTIQSDPGFDGPQVTQVRVINEGRFLEIYWDRYVDENAAVSPTNIVLSNGGTNITLIAKPATGSTNTIFFDRANKQMAATAANSMKQIDPDLHMSSIAYSGTIDTSKPLTVTITGANIEDAGGKDAKDATYTSVPKLNYYTQTVKTATGIVMKAGPRVEAETLQKAAAQVDVELGKTDSGIAANMESRNCSLAIYASLENAYTVPEHRRGYSTTMYDVEGYGGSVGNGCVSSISERNILRTRGNADPLKNTIYANENILAHEFGHAVRLVGIETLADKSLSNELWAVYENAYNTGLWPNTYAMGNIDEYFATLTSVWFDNMAEKPDWNDGVRSPINTRAELKEYDPMAYAFFAKIYNPVSMPAPWDVPGPDVYHGDFTKPPTLPTRATATDVAFGADQFRIVTDSLGTIYQIDQYAGDAQYPQRDIVIWPMWGDGVWSVSYADGFYTLANRSGSAVLSATSDTEVRYTNIAPDASDLRQKWVFVPDESTDWNAYDGQLVNASNGRALVLAGRASTGRSTTLTDGAGTRWLIEDATRTSAQGTPAFLLPVAVTLSSAGQDPVVVNTPQQSFTLPEITDVDGADWSRAGYTFTGWRLNGQTDVLPGGWTVPDGTSAVSLEAVWERFADVAISVESVCRGGTLYLAVKVEDGTDVRVDAQVQTAFGAKTLANVKPGKAKAVAFTTRLASIDAGVVTVTISATVDGEVVTEQRSIAYDAASC
jgi:hypothetical protein